MRWILFVVVTSLDLRETLRLNRQLMVVSSNEEIHRQQDSRSRKKSSFLLKHDHLSLLVCGALPPLRDMDDTWNDSEAKGLLDNETHSTPNRHPQRHLYAVANVLVLLFTNFLTGLVVSECWLEGCSRPSHRSAGLANRLLYKDLDRKSLHPVNFSAFSLQPSRYTAPASAEVDQEWRALGVECKSLDDGASTNVSQNHR